MVFYPKRIHISSWFWVGFKIQNEDSTHSSNTQTRANSEAGKQRPCICVKGSLCFEAVGSCGAVIPMAPRLPSILTTTLDATPAGPGPRWPDPEPFGARTTAGCGCPMQWIRTTHGAIWGVGGAFKHDIVPTRMVGPCLFDQRRSKVIRVSVLEFWVGAKTAEDPRHGGGGNTGSRGPQKTVEFPG